VVRLDVGRAAGDQQSVDLVEQGIAIEPRPERRDHERQRARTVDHAVNVLVAGLVIAEPVALHHARRDANQRRTIGTHHGRSSSRGAENRQASAGELDATRRK
jgi:hypothetical protein